MEHPIKKLKEMEEISLKLDQLDDIFSDFDIRPYSKRALSVDFIDEIKRASHDKNHGEIELTLHIPHAERNEHQEATIKERLNTHFKKHHHLVAKEKKRVFRLGLGMIVLGVICMILASLAIFQDVSGSFGLSFLIVFLEPAAWFLLWEGLDLILFNSKSIKRDLEFYRKMTGVQGYIHFKSY